MPAVTITMTRCAEPDALVRRSLGHALAQVGVTGEVLFIEQKSDSPISADDFPVGTLSLRIERGALPGLSAARNRALDIAAYPLVLFLDADALAEPGWAAALVAALASPKVAIAGARIVPGWPGKPPLLAKARAIHDQYSLLDLGSGTRPYHRVVGAGFGVDMAKLPAALRFDENLGRRDGRLFGGEESDFASRARALGYEIVYAGDAVVTHLVEPERTRLPWIVRRLVYAGHGRAMLGGAPSPSGKRRAADWFLLPAYLPPYAAGWLWGRLSARRHKVR